MLVKLYHGTSEKSLVQLLENGAEKIYLTSDSDQAEYYAECASEEDGSIPKIVVIEVEESLLKADLPSFDEPLSYILGYHDFNAEDDWHEAIEEGEIPYPEFDDWKTSLKYAKTVLALGKILPDQILGEEADLTDEDFELIESLISSKKSKCKP